MIGGSQQLRIFRRAIRDGETLAQAAVQAGMSLVEAKLHAAEDAENPPPEEAFVLLGHNSEGANMSDNPTADVLRTLIERVERINEEIRDRQDDRKDVFAEAKSQGFDVATMREMLRLRAMEKHKRDERQALIETYGTQLGLF